MSVGDFQYPRLPRLVSRVALVVAIAASGGSLFAAQARAAELIEGTWQFEGGEVLVEATGSGTFKGAVVKATKFATCVHPVGQRMWEMSGSGSHYEGTHVWFSSLCAERPGGASTWDITSTDPNNFQLRFCTQEPGTGPVGPSSRCHTLTRSKPPLPKPSEVIKFPGSKRCVSKRKFRIRIRQPKGVQIQKATVSLNDRRVKTLKKKVFGKKRVTATIDLRGLPRRTFRVKITVLTTTGDVIKGTRKYKTCRKKGRKPRRQPRL